MPLANYLSTEMQPQQNMLLLEMESNGIHLTKIKICARVHTHTLNSLKTNDDHSQLMELDA